jgi:hypothetical protein
MSQAVSQGTLRGAGKRAAIAAIGAFTVLAVFASGARAAAPLIESTQVSGVTATTATLKAVINPQGVVTRYRFEYGLVDCAVGPCTKAPKVEGQIPKGSSPVAVEVAIEGLSPATFYHFRVVAKNPEVSEGPDRVFATVGQTFEGLPDGRAYEQASPLNKDGGDAELQQSLVKATPTGDGITYASNFGMPGGKGAGSIPTFLASRGVSQWSSQGLLPPSSVGERTQVIGWSPDYSRLYSRAIKLGSPATEALVEQSSQGGSPIVIAPYVTAPRTGHYSFAGETADGSVVFFEAPFKLPPKAGDPPIAAATEGVPNLYAWDRASNEIHLVGAFNEGAPKGSFAGPFDWSFSSNNFSLNGGGGLRSYYLRDMHAITPSGDAYFTAAGTAQVYLRRNPTEAQSPLDGEGKCSNPELACTVHVSASKKTNGEGPGGTDPAGQQFAAFQAASEDGSKVFFTSPEKLTNDANTGPEQPQPAIVRGGIGGTVEDEEFILGRAVGVARSGPWIYWTNPTAGTIGRAKLDGEENLEAGSVKADFISIPPSEGECEEETEPGVFAPIADPIPSEPRYLAVEGEHLYWTNTGRRDNLGAPIDGGGTIGRAKLNGEGDASEIEPALICGEEASQPGKRLVSNPQGIAVNATDIYWANAVLRGGLSSSIGRAAIDGSGAEERFVTPFGESIPYGVALSPTHIYFVINDETNNFSFISRVPLEGGKQEGPFVGEEGLRGLAVDSTHVYWTTQGEGGAIGRIDLELSPGSKENKFIDIEGAANGIAAGAAHLFWAANGDTSGNPGNDLYRYEPAGNVLTDLAPLSGPGNNGAEVQGVLGVSGDGSRVYFAANGVLAEGATQGNCKGSVHTAKGKCNLYLWDNGQVSLIGRLDANGGTETDALDWVGTPLEIFGSGSYAAKTAFLGEEGTVLVFRSQEQLTAYDNEGTPEFYRYRAGQLTCLTCRPSGEAPGGGPASGTNTTFPQIQPGNDVQAVASRNLSADGRHFFFETPEALSPLDTNGEGGCPFLAEHFSCTDVYEWESPETPQCQESSPSYSPLNEGCIYLISTGKSPFPSYFGDASEDGSNVFFFTRQALVGQDKDELQDVYDARVGGGLPAQNEVKPPPCESTEACHGPAQAPPGEGQGATSTFVGPGDPVPKHKKQKAKKKKKKKHTQNKHKQKKHGRAKVEQGRGR